MRAIVLASTALCLATAAASYDPVKDTRTILAGTVSTQKIKNEYLSGARDSTAAFKGALNAYKADLVWTPISELSVRGGYQHAVRGPNVNELYGGLSRTNPLATDPCSSRQPTAAPTTGRSPCTPTRTPASSTPTWASPKDGDLPSTN